MPNLTSSTALLPTSFFYLLADGNFSVAVAEDRKLKVILYYFVHHKKKQKLRGNLVDSIITKLKRTKETWQVAVFKLEIENTKMKNIKWLIKLLTVREKKRSNEKNLIGLRILLYIYVLDYVFLIIKFEAIMLYKHLNVYFL